MTKLQNVIAYLGAVEVAPGRYARRECLDVPFEIIPEEILREYEPERIATFSHRDRQFCGIVTMPVWWAPERRFAYVRRPRTSYWTTKDPSPNAQRFTTFDEALAAGLAIDAEVQRITADLETGEEIPA